MKAKDYFEKYDAQVWAEAHAPGIDTNGPTAQMFIEFVAETKQIIEKRHAQTDSAALAVIDEQNQKWNAVSNMFEKKYGESPIHRNGFETALKKGIA